jgi:hypothetical protein
LGPELSLLAICEVIDHPDVKRRGEAIWIYYVSNIYWNNNEFHID